jgi:hypothetical protein
MKKITNKDVYNLHQCMHLLNTLLAGKKLDGNKLRQDKLLEYKISLANINKYLANISNTIDSKPKKKVKKKKKSK